MLGQIIRRVIRSKRLDALVVATSINPEDDSIAALCRTLDVPCHRGSENDVLQRFLEVSQAYGADIVVRLTGDNPIVDGDLIDFVMEYFFAATPPIVYANNIDDSGFPYGLFVEAIDAGALREAAADTSPENREHVTHHIRTHPENYASITIAAPGSFPDESLTIDTPEDYERVSGIFEKHFEKSPDFSFLDLIAG